MRITRRYTHTGFLVLLIGFVAGCSGTSEEMLYETGFERIDSLNWLLESETPVAWNALFKEGYLNLDVPKGITVWLNKPLTRDVVIEFEAEVVDEGGPNDRVSDLNCFWMATDPVHPDNFQAQKDWRGGIFWRYYSLNLYYVGLGGHDNSKTRLRRYHATDDPLPEVLQECTDPGCLITPNHRVTIRIICEAVSTRYLYNGQLVFELDETDPLDSGYFGFRTVNNHMRIHRLSIYRPQAESRTTN